MPRFLIPLLTRFVTQKSFFVLFPLWYWNLNINKFWLRDPNSMKLGLRRLYLLISCKKVTIFSIASVTIFLSSFLSSFLFTERNAVSFIIVATSYYSNYTPFLIAAARNLHGFLHSHKKRKVSSVRFLWLWFLVTNDFEPHSLFSFLELKLNVRFEFSNKTIFNVIE